MTSTSQWSRRWKMMRSVCAKPQSKRYGRGISPQRATDFTLEQRRCPMDTGAILLDTWMVVEPINSMKPVSLHASQAEAEAERDRRNKNLARPRYSACIVVE